MTISWPPGVSALIVSVVPRGTYTKRTSFLVYRIKKKKTLININYIYECVEKKSMIIGCNI